MVASSKYRRGLDMSCEGFTLTSRQEVGGQVGRRAGGRTYLHGGVAGGIVGLWLGRKQGGRRQSGGLKFVWSLILCLSGQGVCKSDTV